MVTFIKMKITSLHHEPQYTQPWKVFPLSKLHNQRYAFHIALINEQGDYPVDEHVKLVPIESHVIYVEYL